ncbi:MAG: hypothetical protein KC656_31925 [Myxococcales bacterium]|nr:hypothetical protein [Myxococcales bacterium]
MEAATRRLTYQEYLDIEATTGVEHELLHGRVFAMSGGSFNHAVVCACRRWAGSCSSSPT